MKLRSAFYLIAALTATASTVNAQVQVKVTSAAVPGGSAVAWDPPGSAYGPLYVSPYTGVLMASNTSVVLNCVDFFHHVSLNAPWMANQTYLNSGNISATRFDNLQLYLQAAWLTQQYAANPGSTPNRTIAIQTAIWQLFSPTAPDKTDGSGVTSQSYWFNQSAIAANWQSVDASRFYVLTAVGARPDNSDRLQQEFLVYGPSNPPPTTVPEPATMTLLATGMVGVLGAARRRRKAKEAQAING